MRREISAEHPIRRPDVGGDTGHTRPRHRVSTLALLVVAVGLATAGCDDGGGTPATAMSIGIYHSPLSDNPFDGVSLVRLQMLGSDLEAPVTAVAAYAPGVAVTLDAPYSTAGATRQLVVEGWSTNADGQPTALVSRGRSLELTVRPDDDPLHFDVLMGRVNHFLNLTAANDLSQQKLGAGRVGHSAVVTEAGEIVIAGGAAVSQADATWWSAERVDQVHRLVSVIDRATHQVLARPDMLLARTWHSATPLGSGQVILAGGFGAGSDPLKSVELYNPPTVLDGAPKPLRDMAVARAGHTATMIDPTTRQILFVGGDEAGTWELWDPINGSSGVRPLPDNVSRRYHTATKFFLAGRTEPAVLIAGGQGDSLVHSTAILYDSVADAMVPVAQAMPAGRRMMHSATYVPARNFIYLVGGFTDVTRGGVTSQIDVFNVATVGFVPGQDGFRMRTARGGHSAVLLPNNTVMIAGGRGEEPVGTTLEALGSIEVIHEFMDPVESVLRIEVASSWDPENSSADVPYMPASRVGHRAVSAGNGMSLLIGGASAGDAGFSPVLDLTLYNPL